LLIGNLNSVNQNNGLKLKDVFQQGHSVIESFHPLILANKKDKMTHCVTVSLLENAKNYLARVLIP